jgi:hypothetical protein
MQPWHTELMQLLLYNRSTSLLSKLRQHWQPSSRACQWASWLVAEQMLLLQWPWCLAVKAPTWRLLATW